MSTAGGRRIILSLAVILVHATVVTVLFAVLARSRIWLAVLARRAVRTLSLPWWLSSGRRSACRANGHNKQKR
jgi:hypothetical protein